jgi:FKBP-type peptidyl-prolyl cis-trans isomerase FkpA
MQILKSLTMGLALAVTAWAAQAQTNTTPKGAQYQIFSGGNNNRKIQVNDVITFNVIQKTATDSVLFSTYPTGKPVKLQVQPSQNVGDLMDVFVLLAEKDSAVVKVPVDSIFKGYEDKRPPFMAKGGFVLFNLKINRVQSLNEAIEERNAGLAKQKAEEPATINKYITDKGFVVTTTPSGLKYKVTQAGGKRNPVKGDTLQVNYTGMLLDGRVFDSSIEADAKNGGVYQPGRPYQPFEFVVGSGNVIKGWDEGLLLLAEGAKATFVIPSALAYGDTGTQGIAPYSPLVFNVELVKIKPAKHLIKKPIAHKKKKKTSAKSKKH